MSPRKWRALRQTLVDNEKIAVRDGLIHQERCQRELERAAEIIRKRAESGSKGGRITATRQKKAKENSTTDLANATAVLHPPSPSPSPTTSKKEVYAFAGRVIRLKECDFTRWSEAFQAIPDLRALLQSRDDWLATEVSEKDQRHWFTSTSNYLANQNTRFLAEQAASQADEYDPDFIN